MSEYVRHDDLGTVIRALTRRIEALERPSALNVPVIEDEDYPEYDFLKNGDMWFEAYGAPDNRHYRLAVYFDDPYSSYVHRFEATEY